MQNPRLTQNKPRTEEKPVDDKSFWDSLPTVARYDAILRSMREGFAPGMAMFGVLGGFGKPTQFVREWEA